MSLALLPLGDPALLASYHRHHQLRWSSVKWKTNPELLQLWLLSKHEPVATTIPCQQYFLPSYRNIYYHSRNITVSRICLFITATPPNQQFVQSGVSACEQTNNKKSDNFQNSTAGIDYSASYSANGSTYS